MEGPKGKSAFLVKVGPKGQIVLPKKLRETFGITTGEEVLILADEEKGIVILKENERKALVESLFNKI